MAGYLDIIALCPINKNCGLIKGSKIASHYSKVHRGQGFHDHLFSPVQLESVPKNSNGCEAFSITENWDNEVLPANRLKELIQVHQAQPIETRFVS